MCLFYPESVTVSCLLFFILVLELIFEANVIVQVYCHHFLLHIN